MNSDVFILIGMVVGFAVMGYLISRSRKTSDVADILDVLQKNAHADRSSLLHSLQTHTHHVNQRLDKAAHVIAGVQKSVGEMNEIGRSMHEIQQLLHAPKIRGSIGEQVLKQLLSQVLPHGSYKLQHRFRNNAVVDALITTTNGSIPIDAKFPLSAYRRMNKTTVLKDKAAFKKEFLNDVKKHIDDISRKYIQPESGTIDYALMYIPAEGVFYELVNDDSLLEYAHKKHVLPVSPITFYAFIKAILMSLEGERMNAQAREIITLIQSIQHDYEKADKALHVLNRHVTNSYNASSVVTTTFAKIGQTLTRTNQLKQSGDQPTLKN